MIKTKYLLFCGLALGFVSSVFADSKSKCFRNGGLKDEDTIAFVIEGEKVTGTYSIMRDYSTDTIETYEFSGKKSGKTATVKLDGKGPVNARPVGLSTMEMSLVQTGDDEILKVKFFNAKRKLIDSYEFESCEPSYAKLAKSAKRVALGGAHGSAKETVKLESPQDRKAYWIKIAKGQTFRIEGPGLKISFYYPDKTPYAEGSAIDTLSMEKLPQAGDYLVVLGAAGDPAERAVQFTVTE